MSAVTQVGTHGLSQSVTSLGLIAGIAQPKSDWSIPTFGRF